MTSFQTSDFVVVPLFSACFNVYVHSRHNVIVFFNVYNDFGSFDINSKVITFSEIIDSLYTFADSVYSLVGSFFLSHWQLSLFC